MSTNWFLILNVLLVGVIGWIILFYLIFLTRKRLLAAYLHQEKENKNKETAWKRFLWWLFKIKSHSNNK